MENNTQKRVPIHTLIIYFLCFYAAWSVYHFFIRGFIEQIPNDILSGIIGDGVCKNLVWSLPAFLLIRKYSENLDTPLKTLFSFQKSHIKYIAVFPIALIYLLFGFWVRKTPIHFSLTAKQVIAVLFVGLTEEIVFRGWLLNSFLPYAGKCEENGDITSKQYIAIGINAVMFLLIHFPIWICDGVFVTNFVSLGFLSIIFLSFVFSWLFIRTNSLILPITLHMFWDLLIFAMQ